MIAALAAVLLAAGLVAGAAAALATRRPLDALPVALDLWQAAGILRLSGPLGSRALAVAGATVLVRRLAAAGVRRAAAGRAARPPARAGAGG